MPASIQLNQSQMLEVKAVLAGVKDSIPKIAMRAINKTETNVQTKAAQLIGQVINLSAARIKEDFTLNKATTSNLSGSVIAKGDPVGLASFTGTRQVIKGVSVKILKTGTRVILRHAFLATVRGSAHVFWRVWEEFRKPVRKIQYAKLPTEYRFPLERLTGPRIEDIYAKAEIFSQVEQHADVQYKSNIENELNYEISRLK